LIGSDRQALSANSGAARIRGKDDRLPQRVAMTPGPGPLESTRSWDVEAHEIIGNPIHRVSRRVAASQGCRSLLDLQSESDECSREEIMGARTRIMVAVGVCVVSVGASLSFLGGAVGAASVPSVTGVWLGYSPASTTTPR